MARVPTVATAMTKWPPMPCCSQRRWARRCGCNGCGRTSTRGIRRVQQLLDLRGGVDAQGNITAWDVEMWVPANVPGARPLLSIDAAGMAQDHGQGAGLMTQNADTPYATANVRVVAHLVKETPLRPSNLRAPGKIANTFATEAFTDEMAAAAGGGPGGFPPRAPTRARRSAA